MRQEGEGREIGERISYNLTSDSFEKSEVGDGRLSRKPVGNFLFVWKKLFDLGGKK